jgi:hypothetical protein
MFFAASLSSCDEWRDQQLINEGEFGPVDTASEALQKCKGGVSGDTDYCNNVACPCDAGEGDCDQDSQCTVGNVCALNNGPNFGFGDQWDICVPPHCVDKVQDFGETGVECGDADCGVCVPVVCTPPPMCNANHCSPSCPCAGGEGDCDSNLECVAGTTCATDVGTQFGCEPLVDVCKGTTCANGVIDGDETGVDCGGSCPSCNLLPGFAFGIGTAGFERVASIQVDNVDGSFYVAGQFENTLTIGAANLVSNGGMDIFVAKFSSVGVPLWAHSYGSPINDGDFDLELAIDPKTRRVASVGSFVQTVDFGGGPLTADGTDGFLLVLDQNGNFVTAAKYGGVGLDRLGGVGWDSIGDLYVGGTFPQTMTFGATVLTSAGLNDIAVAKFSPALAVLWAKKAGGTGDDVQNGLWVSADKGVMVAGQFTGTLPFVGNLVSAGKQDAALLKWSTTGVPTMGIRIGGLENDVALGVAADTANQPVVVGTFKGTVDFGAGNVIAPGGISHQDGFTVAYTAAGGFRWARTIGGTLNDQAVAVTVDTASKDVAVGGYIQGTVNGFTAAGGSVTALGGDDTFIVKYSQLNGSTTKADHYGGTADDYLKAMANKNGTVYAVGNFFSTVSIGATAIASKGSEDGFAASFSVF